MATLILGVILIFLSHFPFSDWLTAELAKSQIPLWLMAIAKVLTPLLPKIIIIKIILKNTYGLLFTAYSCYVHNFMRIFCYNKDIKLY